MTQIDKRIKLINYLHNMLEFAPTCFNLSTYLTAESPEAFDAATNNWPVQHRRGQQLECGTTACVVGHLPVVFPNDFKWKPTSEVTAQVFTTDDVYVCEMTMEEFFGCSATDWSCVIYPENYGPADDITLQQVLDKIYEIHDLDIADKSL